MMRSVRTIAERPMLLVCKDRFTEELMVGCHEQLKKGRADDVKKNSC
jgi:hypothetical protein